MRVAEDLHLDVFRPADVAFDEHFRPAERRAGFALCFFKFAWQFLGVPHDPHAPPAAAEAGFEHDREADFLGGGFHLGEIFQRVFSAWNRRHIGFIRESLGRGLVAERFRSSAVGPTNVIPCSRQARASPAFSERNPYPG